LRTFIAVVVLLATALVTGCASLPAEDAVGQMAGKPASAATVTRFELSGRLAVKQGESGQYGNLRWNRSPAGQELTLLTPLGQTAAVVNQDPSGVTLVTNQRQYRATDGDTLTREVLGYTLPVNGLAWWILGEPVPGTPAQVERRPNGTTATLTQDGWRIEYPDYVAVEGTLLPRRVLLRRDDLDIRLVIDNWQLGAGT
jgi:outer membrane lipoprotein LolB